MRKFSSTVVPGSGLVVGVRVGSVVVLIGTVGSTVTVGERRALVVIGAVLTAMPAVAARRK